MFAHEKLLVYSKVLEFAAQAAVWTVDWEKKHSIVDHLSRATESIALNLAEATRQRIPVRLRTIDYATGSTLECAGCLDLARIKKLLVEADCHRAKLRLCEITKMLIGLRKAWAQSSLHEEASADPQEPATFQSGTLFHHETLEAYRAALAFMEWFVDRSESKALPTRFFRLIDEAGTSAVLNIAEGNGRYSELDHLQLLRLAECAAVKASVYLDIAIRREFFAEKDARVGKEILCRMSSLIAGFLL